MLTRSRGSFPELLESSDLIVELIGGIDPAREYVLAAMEAGDDWEPEQFDGAWDGILAWHRLRAILAPAE